MTERQLAYRALGETVERILRRADLPATRCHAQTLRWTFAAGFLRDGGGIWQLQEALGLQHLESLGPLEQIFAADPTARRDLEERQVQEE